MDPDHRRRLEANIFPFAHAAIQSWEEFPWHLDGSRHCDSHKPHSSQALAMDVFGTLAVLDAADRDSILENLAARIGLPTAGPWSVQLEWSDTQNRLRESGQQKSQIDAVAVGKRSVIFFECKFTEENGGKCSQVNPLRSGAHRGLRQCNGTYSLQVNPANGRSSRCSLTAKGIRYWELVPSLFELANDVDHSPCPFAGPSYQWMRNLILAKAVTDDEGKSAAFVITYADSPRLKFPRQLKSPAWDQFMRWLPSSSVPVVTRSYLELIKEGEGVLSGPGAMVLKDLFVWVERKIEQACTR